MNKNIQIAIEEWAGDNCIKVTIEQINELTDALDICSEIEMGSNGFALGHSVKSEDQRTIKYLEKKIQTLESFLSSKGLSISYDVGYVTEHTMEMCGTAHVASNRKTTYY